MPVWLDEGICRRTAGRREFSAIKICTCNVAPTISSRVAKMIVFSQLINHAMKVSGSLPVFGCIFQFILWFLQRSSNDASYAAWLSEAILTPYTGSKVNGLMPCHSRFIRSLSHSKLRRLLIVSSLHSSLPLLLYIKSIESQFRCFFSAVASFFFLRR